MISIENQPWDVRSIESLIFQDCKFLTSNHRVIQSLWGSQDCKVLIGARLPSNPVPQGATGRHRLPDPGPQESMKSTQIHVKSIKIDEVHRKSSQGHQIPQESMKSKQIHLKSHKIDGIHGKSSRGPQILQFHGNL